MGKCTDPSLKTKLYCQTLTITQTLYTVHVSKHFLYVYVLSVNQRFVFERVCAKIDV